LTPAKASLSHLVSDIDLGESTLVPGLAQQVRGEPFGVQVFLVHGHTLRPVEPNGALAEPGMRCLRPSGSGLGARGGTIDETLREQLRGGTTRCIV
jgi:hypothetical protein